MKELAQVVNPLLPYKIGGGPVGGSGKPTTQMGISAVGGFISSIISVFLIVALVSALLYLVIGGVQWITSGGEKGALEQARNRITNAIIGLMVVAAAWAVWLLVGKFLGIDVTHLPFPTLGTQP